LDIYVSYRRIRFTLLSTTTLCGYDIIPEIFEKDKSNTGRIVRRKFLTKHKTGIGGVAINNIVRRLKL